MSKKQQNHSKEPQNKKKHFRLSPFEDITAAPAFDYVGLGFDEVHECYEPPVNRFALARLPSQNAQHCGILNSRANMISANYTGGALTRQEMRALTYNLITFGDVGLLKIRNGFGQVVRLAVLSSLYLRKMKNGNFRYLMRKSLNNTADNTVYTYHEKEIIFIKLYDPIQQVYGVPDYLGGLQSALLNSDATIFRRRYYSNGAHMGFILYSTDPDVSEEMEKEIAEKLTGSKGVGNFRSMYVNVPNGNPDGLKVIPIGDTGKKDEFGSIKNISAQDILTAHRFPPGLSGIIPQTGSFGDPIKMREVYRLDEVLPMQELIAESINRDKEIQGALQIRFKQENIE